ncbi:hypothetical protein ALC56_00268 [Trachymyrmex septentrionalis]|uniref:Uncharacterized protein n=1 Tax=Trachymyrmex septentrionalis TaxID=34720 RepID=A0A151K1E9_9HYME|nr:hypothetical protein ALC56_00268 [Trachymyrmex septentrionalis]
MAVPKNLVNFTLETFNSLHNKLKFTLEFSDDKINILDITVINNNLIEFDWYHKPTYSERRYNTFIKVQYDKKNQVKKPRGIVLLDFVLPYIPKISDKFKRISKTFNIKLAFTSLNKLNSLIKGYKDILPKEMRKNVVYKISCKSCNVSYVG